VKHFVQEALLGRILSDGGVADRPGGEFRIDSTAFTILTLVASGEPAESLEPCRARLIKEQADDGRVAVSRNHPASYWPTPLAILAWQNSLASQFAQSRAIHFLLSTSGTHFRRTPDAAWAHDTSLKGWPWIEATHSWVEPTAIGVVALRGAGHMQHARVKEAVRLLIDRQLPHGGWNVGNTLMFGRELHPNPEGTGAALLSLVKQVEHRIVERSLDYLRGEVNRLRTPMSLGWALLGLAAWEQYPSNGAALLERCLASQSRYGAYETSALCLLFLGALGGESSTRHPFLSLTGY
jgi:hypothetical protein